MAHTPANRRSKTPGSRPNRLAGLFAAASLLIFPLEARAEPCSLALVVALDVSASVDAREYDLQLTGLANALQDPLVVEAINSVGGIWFSSFEWSGHYQQKTLLDWRFLTGENSVAAAAVELADNTRSHKEFMTALGYALAHGSRVLRNAPSPCQRLVIDVSSDGANNTGFEPEIAYRDASFLNVTVNALVILNDEHTDDYFAEKVIRGPGAFVEVTASYDDYQTAMTRKLLREIGTKLLAQNASDRNHPIAD
ncbi:DUF1194 domain-containing protein [Labrenzia sp. PHM005]|uniref:DUF1194 domain-containing protein n=1 Tax=Labrenzia sp. PHM005 TaxID=2590016 RepID=UPI0011404F59|nr:DUF1194 domain-containing protein [Labrenzia sp. PHM005]QDG75189.1 DUF1194 domain-containing protein [Labrenzia sp. PHM005]